MASSSCLHPALERVVKSRQSIFIYGPAGTGKTHLAYAIYECIRGSLDAVLIATEPGTLVFGRHYGVEMVEAMSLDELVSKVTGYVLRGFYPIIDTINWHYRSSPNLDSARMLAYLSSLLYASGGTAFGQVSLDGVASGSVYIEPWMKYIGVTEKVGENKFKLRFIKPSRLVILYRVGGAKVEWL